VSAEQTAGTGRRGRRWVSPKGGLYFSILLRPKRQSGLPLLTLVGALSAVEGIRKDTGIIPRLRWPNDIVFEGKKLGGVIAEATFSGNELAFVVLGIGVNCNFSARKLGEVARHSTTTKDILGTRLDLVILREKILETFSHLYSLWVDGKDKTILEKVRLMTGTLGRRVEIQKSDETITGVALALNNDASLSIKTRGATVNVKIEDMEILRER
jgi:BirA family biotin operon repressor/biotin-[acetyl-CoA-carboxylase] ligase